MIHGIISHELKILRVMEDSKTVFLKKCSAWRLKSQANPTMKELVAEILIIHGTAKELKGGTGNVSGVKLCESYPWGTRGRLSPASPAIDLFPRVPRDKRLLQAEDRMKKEAK